MPADGGGRTRAEEAREDQHALGMKRAAQLDLPFDVEHLTLAQPYPGSDPAGLAEGELAKL